MKKTTLLLSLFVITSISCSNLYAQDNSLVKKTNTKFEALTGNKPVVSTNKALCSVMVDCTDGDHISRIVIESIDNSSDCTLDGYNDFTTQSTAITAGHETPVAVTVGAGWAYEHVGVWIDYNNDENFTADEFHYIGVGSGNTVYGHITPKVATLTGTYVARFHVNAGPIDPTTGCDVEEGYGEYEDYTFNISAALECSGVPSNLALITPTTVCVGSEFTIRLNSPITTTSMTGQLQASTNGSTWNNIGSPIDVYEFTNLTLNQETQYRVILTCAATDESVTSTISTVQLKDYQDCYCIPNLECTDNDVITHFSIVEVDYENNSGCGTNGYTSYMNQPIHGFESNQTYNINVMVGNGFEVESVSLWIDYNKNGIFEEDEFTLIGAGSGQMISGTVVIPNVGDGTYIMRLRVAAVGTGLATFDMACDEDQLYGETEDYLIVFGELSVLKQTLDNVVVYPNPTNGIVQISGLAQDATIAVVDMTGRVILTSTGNAGVDASVNLADFSAGTYTVHIATETGSTVKRVIRF